MGGWLESCLNHNVADLAREDAETLELHPEGYGIDKRNADLVYIPHEARGNLSRLTLWWTHDGQERSLPLRPGKPYMTPSGYKIQLDKHPSSGTWRLIGQQ